MESPHAINGQDPLDSLLATAKKLADKGAVRDEIVSGIYGVSAGICSDAVTYHDKKKLGSTYKLDNIVTSKIWGFPLCWPPWPGILDYHCRSQLPFRLDCLPLQLDRRLSDRRLRGCSCPGLAARRSCAGAVPRHLMGHQRHAAAYDDFFPGVRAAGEFRLSAACGF